MTTQVTATVVGGLLKPDRKLELADETRVNLTIEPLGLKQANPSSILRPLSVSGPVRKTSWPHSGLSALRSVFHVHLSHWQVAS